MALRNRRYSKTFLYPDVWGFSSEMEMFHHLWLENPHISYLSGHPIINPTPANFAHVLPKAIGKYPLFRLYPKNVVIVTVKEHNLIDAGTEFQREMYANPPDGKKTAVDWDAYHSLRLLLLDEYQKFEKAWKFDRGVVIDDSASQF